MYEAVHAYPRGNATAARFARTAADYGFQGVVVRTRGGDPADCGLDGAPPPSFDRIRAETDVDVVDAAEIVADEPSTASGAVGNYRPEYTVVLVRGGSDAMNRFAVEQERVDVLTRPFAGDGDFNHVLAKAARDNDVRVEFDLGGVLRQEGGQRVRTLRKLRKLREILGHYGTPFVVSANPTSHLQLRAPRELRAVGEAIGFEAETIEDGLREWGEVAARNRERRSDSFVAPGVRSGRYEEARESESADGENAHDDHDAGISDSNESERR